MKWINLITVLAVIGINALANILPINGQTTGEVSAHYEGFFTPAGFTFSIWSLIYLSLLWFAVYQFYSEKYHDRSTGIWVGLNGLANISWILAWHFEFISLTILIMLFLLVTLIVLNLRTLESPLFVKVPFRIYLGWICVATIANFSVWLKYMDWSAWGIPEIYWGMLMVLVAGGVGLLLNVKKGLALSALAISWGLLGLYLKPFDDERVHIFRAFCLLAIIIVLLSFVWRKKKMVQKTDALA